MRILVITDQPPFPMISGASLRIHNLLQRIAREHDVWLAALTATPEHLLAVAHMREFCADVETAEIEPAGALARPLDGLRHLLTGKPPDLRLYHSEELAGKIRQLIARERFDVAQIELGHMGLYLKVLPQDLRERSVWTLHDIDWSKYARLSALEPKLGKKLRLWLHSCLMRQWEPRQAEGFKRCVTMSETDRQLLLAANPRLRIDVIPNGVDTHVNQVLPDSSTTPALIFVGNMGARVSIDAMAHFCQETLPLIRREIANVELWVVGKNPAPEVERLDGNGVHVTGRVEDVRPYYGRSTVCVVPLRAGGGTRLKILEAMALGRPVVSTSIGCEGIEVVDGEHLFIADSPDAFAERTVRLLTDAALRQHVTNRARELAVSRYDWDVIAKQLMQVYAEVAR